MATTSTTAPNQISVSGGFTNFINSALNTGANLFAAKTAADVAKAEAKAATAQAQAAAQVAATQADGQAWRTTTPGGLTAQPWFMPAAIAAGVLLLGGLFLSLRRR